MEKFREFIQARIDADPNQGAINVLLDQFPPELQEKLESRIADMDGHDAEDFLMNHLIERRKALAVWGVNSLPQTVEVSREAPLAFLNRIQSARERGEDAFIGAGHNGMVLQSLRSPENCYKILHPKRVREVNASVVREATMQYTAWEFLHDKKGVARVPQVKRYVQTPEVQAFMMERVEGESLRELMSREAEFPPNFDIDQFFEKLRRSIELLNERGFHHRDLTNNLGNVMVDNEGNPWLIDFGSAVKGSPSPDNPNHYQITAGMPYIVGHDQTGIETLKVKVQDYLRKQGERHGK